MPLAYGILLVQGYLGLGKTLEDSVHVPQGKKCGDNLILLITLIGGCPVRVSVVLGLIRQCCLHRCQILHTAARGTRNQGTS